MSAVTDLLRTVRIKVGLLADHRVSGLDVNVDVDGGVARLSGTVQSEEQKQTAEEIAASIEGVVEIENDIVVASSEERTESLEEGGACFGY
ncbi:MAG: BON domain-containing protein [Armatimonadota bacterium]|nr:BON domain-containing protein [Armatimonadota bacterium]